MFLGHFGAALMGPAAAPRLRLAPAVAAALGLDLLWPWLCLAGVERAYVSPATPGVFPVVLEHAPWSHGLLMTLAWSSLAFALVRWRSGTYRSAGVVAGLVSTHWVLDAVVHRGDMMLGVATGSARVGLGLWNHTAVSMALEAGVFAAGLTLYLRSTHLAQRGRVLVGALVALLVAVQIGMGLAPPPPEDLSSFAIAAPTLGMWLAVVWAWRIDVHGQNRLAPRA